MGVGEIKDIAFELGQYGVDTIVQRDPMITGLTLELRYKHTKAIVAVGEQPHKWATVYLIETDPGYRRQGNACGLLSACKVVFEKLGFAFGSTVALNTTMRKILKSLEIREYV